MRFAGEKMGGGFTDFLTDQPDFGMLGENSIQNRFKETAAGIQGESMTSQYGLKSMADVLAAEYGAQATKAAGQAEGQASIVSGLASGVSSAAGGFMKAKAAGAGLGADPFRDVSEADTLIPASFEDRVPGDHYWDSSMPTGITALR